MSFHPAMERSLFELVAASGCKELTFGLESASDHVLALMNKPFRTVLARRVLRDARAAGIETRVNLIVGYPGETEDDHTQTERFLREEAGSIGAVNLLAPFHLTRHSDLWRERREAGILPERCEIVEWEAEDGNTLAVRLRRGERLLGLLAELAIPIVHCTLPVDPSAGRHAR